MINIILMPRFSNCLDCNICRTFVLFFWALRPCVCRLCLPMCTSVQSLISLSLSLSLCLSVHGCDICYLK